LVEATVQEFRDKTRLYGSLSDARVFAPPRFEDEPKKVKTEQLRNEASLNFVSLRSLFHYVSRLGLSRVEMNARRAVVSATP
jgi:hypothetical protein